MSNTVTAIEIIKTLYPTLKLAGKYACEIQHRVSQQPEKAQYGENFYATALSDADLTVQTAVELALLAQFPQIRFFGEEHEKSYNTKYFTGITPQDGEFLITLDPIDGTRHYIDGLSNFAIILSIIKDNSYEVAITIMPRKNQYIYAERGKGAFIGNLSEDNDISKAQKLSIAPLKSRKLYLGFVLASLKNTFESDFETYCSATDYNPSINPNPPEYLDIIKGELGGVILAKGNLIDSAILAFIVKEAGGIVTYLNGENFQPFSEIEDMKIPQIIVAHNSSIHQEILTKLKS